MNPTAAEADMGESTSKIAIASYLARHYGVGVVEAEALVEKYSAIVQKAITARDPTYKAADLIAEAEHIAEMEED